MSRFALQALDWGFLILHTALVLFNALGWAWRRTRRWNLATLALTAISWFVMGLWKGVGYCLCTDWHWQVRHALGYRDHCDTYIQFLAQELLHRSFDSGPIRIFSGVVFGISVVGSVTTNLRDRRARSPSTLTATHKEG